MATQRTCEECGAELPANAPQGLCPRCLAGMGLSLAASESARVPAESEIRNPKSEIGSKVRYFGDYELLEEIARGGMGIVYRARQVSLNRIVAVKMLLFGKFSSDEFVQRFQTEAQAVASLQHPNIVAIHEVGEHEGQHYFSMDYIEGKSLAELVRENPLPTRRAAGYINTIAEAIHHAHQHGVLHRDLKPSNVLIDEFDQPRITDFGLAKQLKRDSELTVTGQVLGSPNFMPPEQADAKRGAMGAHSDVYSLGAILYHLLTGRPPFVAETLEDTLRQLLNNEPVSPRLLNASVPRDLETICLKCLEKEPAGRYQTAKELAEELERFRNDETINARPISRPERVWRWCRRRPVVASLIVALHLVFATGLAGILWQWQQAKASQKKSETEAAKATAISDFLQQMLSSANPDELKGSEYTVRQLLDDFSAGLANQLQDQPEVEAAVRATIGRAYFRLGVTDKAQAHHERALTLRRRIFGAQAEPVAESLLDYAWTSLEQGQYAKGETCVGEALEIYRKRDTAGQPVIYALWALQRVRIAQSRFADVEAILEEALSIARKSPGVEFPELASMIHGLADVKNGQSRYAEAESLALKAVEMHRRLRGAEHPETAWALVTVGVALRGQQKLADAEAACREAQRIFRKYYPSGHNGVDAAMHELKLVLEAKGDPTAVEVLYQEVLAGQRAKLGNDSPAVAETLSSLAASLYSQGKQAEAEKAAHEAMAILPKLRDQDLAKLPPVVRQLAGALKSQGKAQDAEKLFEEAIRVAHQKLGETNLILGDLLHDYGDFLEHEYKLEAAAEYHLKSLPIRRAHPDDNLCWTLRNLGDELVWTGRPQEAEAYYREALALYRKLHQQENISGTAWPSLTLGDALYRQHKLPEAEQAYRDALAAYKKCQALDSEDCTRAVRSLLGVLKAENKLAETEALYREVFAAHHSALGYDSYTVAATLCDLADYLKSQNRPEEAAKEYREALGLRLDPHTEDLVKLPLVLEKLAGELGSRGEPDDAEKLYEEAIEVVRRKLGESHPALCTLFYNFSNFLTRESRFDAAAKQCLKALEARRATKDDALAETLRRLGWIQIQASNPKDAERSLRESLEVYRTLHQQDDYQGTALPTLNLAVALFRQHRLAEAERTCHEAIAAISKFRTPDNNHVYFRAVFWLVRVLRTENKLDEAESFLNDVLTHERRITVASALIGDASSFTQMKRPDDPETCNFLFRCASEILQKLPAEDFIELPYWAVAQLVGAGYKQQATNICWGVLRAPATNGTWFNGVSWFLATAEKPSDRDPALAVELAKRAIGLNADRGDWNTLGVARFRAGDFKQALADLEKSERFEHGHTSFNYFFMAMAHHHLGNVDAARRYHANAIQWMKENSPKHPELVRFRAEAERLLGPAVQPKVENQSPIPSTAK